MGAIIKERISYCCVYSLPKPENTDLRWRTDEWANVEHIRRMIKMRTDLINPEIIKITTTEEVIAI